MDEQRDSGGDETLDPEEFRRIARDLLRQMALDDPALAKRLDAKGFSADESDARSRAEYSDPKARGGGMEGSQ